MLGRIAGESHIAIKTHNPGPGTYGIPVKMSSNGRYLNSAHKNSCVPTFKTPLVNSERQISDKPQKNIPGPGAYTPRETEHNNKYRNCYNVSLHKGERNI